MTCRLSIAVCLLAATLSAGRASDPGADSLRDAPAMEVAARHWAFRPPVRPPLPEPSLSPDRAANPIDALILQKHAKLGITALPEADRRTLIRRVTLDLTGLPPTPGEVREFVENSSTDAYERLVERLLASPRYGERWGRFWLDLARWAESDGFEHNEPRSSAWRYRDYVVQSFNADKPYDRFLREQIAGDELTPYSDEHLIATGFLAAGRSNNNEEDPVVQLNGPRVDMANTVASVTLGLTLSCAQCHDHKFEPITIRDYYAFHAFFVRGQINDLFLRDPALIVDWEKTRPPELDTARTLLDQLVEPVRSRLERDSPPDTGIADAQIREALSADDRNLLDALKQKIRSIEKDMLQRRPRAWGYYSPATSPHPIENLPPRGQFPFPYRPSVLKTNMGFVLPRGDPHQRDAVVTPGLPAILDPSATNFTSRSQLADWLGSDANPLTARVWVNFVWQQHFGRGIVETAGDFGLKGAPPSHPELLDWLAREFMRPSTIAGAESELPRGWSTKHLHRLIVTSAAYKREARHDAANARIDPANRHLWRWEPRRLESEALRDAMLAVSGLLDETMGGPSHPPGNGPFNRRALYLRQHRYRLPAMQALFDAPNASESCPQRHVSTVALQPLHLLNNVEVYRWAEAFATRVWREAGDDIHRQIDRACQIALNRKPDETEREWAARFLAGSPSDPNPANGAAPSLPARGDASQPPPALVHFCHALLNLNEFAYLQ